MCITCKDDLRFTYHGGGATLGKYLREPSTNSGFGIVYHFIGIKAFMKLNMANKHHIYFGILKQKFGILGFMKLTPGVNPIELFWHKLHQN